MGQSTPRILGMPTLYPADRPWNPRAVPAASQNSSKTEGSSSPWLPDSRNLLMTIRPNVWSALHRTCWQGSRSFCTTTSITPSPVPPISSNVSRAASRIAISRSYEAANTCSKGAWASCPISSRILRIDAGIIGPFLSQSGSSSSS